MAKVKVLRGFRAPDKVTVEKVDEVDENGDVVLDGKGKPKKVDVERVTEFDKVQVGVYDAKDLPQEVIAFGLEELYIVKTQ